MTRNEAIIAMCKQCMGIEPGEQFSKVIGECTANNDPDTVYYCPLWQYRPGAKRRNKTRIISEERKKKQRELMKKLHAEGKFKKAKKESKKESKKGE